MSFVIRFGSEELYRTVNYWIWIEGDVLVIEVGKVWKGFVFMDLKVTQQMGEAAGKFGSVIYKSGLHNY